MERNRWETAIRCLEIAVHPNTADDEVIAAVNGFRRTADGTPLSQICIEFSCGGVPLAELARMKESLERLNRENHELREKLTGERTTQTVTTKRLDAAYRRIHELTEEALAAQRLAQAAQEEFESFRAAYAQVADGTRRADIEQRLAAGAARHAPTGGEAAAGLRSFGAFLAEARLAAAQAGAFVDSGTGSGKLPPGQARQR